MYLLRHMNMPTNTDVWSGKFGEQFPGVVYSERILIKQVSGTTIIVLM